MSHTVYATFAKPEEAERAAGALLDLGVLPVDLSVVKPPEEGQEELTTPRSTASNVSVAPNEAADATSGSVYGVEPDEDGGIVETTAATAEPDVDSSDETTDRAVRAAKIGAGIGVAVAVVAMIIPGVGFALGAGALATALAGVAASAGAGAAAGAVVAYLKDAGLEEHVAEEYGEAVQKGGAVLAVSLPSGDVSEAAVNEILAQHGATNVNRYAARESVA